MTLLFVCSGNICRSPMAEGLARRLAADLRVPIEASSAGTLGLVDRPADRHAIAVCREVGVDLREHRSSALTRERILAADVVFVMSPEHAIAVYDLVPDLRDDRLVRMGPLVGEPEILDPIGRWRWTFRRVRRQLEEGLGRWLLQQRPGR